MGTGHYKTHAQAVAAMSQPGLVFEPEPDKVRMYDRLYREVYNRMYDRLSPLYRSIRHITNYPKH